MTINNIKITAKIVQSLRNHAAKPWEDPINYRVHNVSQAQTPKEFWFYTLGVVQKKYSNTFLNSVAIANMAKKKRVLGGYPSYGSMNLVAKSLVQEGKK